ncbi:glycosyltransferase [Seleniivibrio sp.]|uniref:glycosyltransferase n=1 Tax=Seleniivibrio sp. TaxID=2898801 RepID=UPI0025E6B4FB|nr:glycosyltransferase [Seleniivibrio sp.]MCD8552442.1 glycosyltransferase [Seleniivibrio sp.]
MTDFVRLNDETDMTESADSVLYYGKDPAGIREKLRGKVAWDRLLAIKDIGVPELADYAEALMNTPKVNVAGGGKLLAVVSPLPPLKTGIAKYAVELAEGLKEHYMVELITDQTDAADIPDGCAVRSVSYFKKNYRRYDRVLYQMGNSGYHAHMPRLMRNYPGVTVLHEIFLGHFAAWMQYMEHASDFHTEAVLFSHGLAGLNLLAREGHEAAMEKLPSCREFFAGSVGVLVHSRYAENLSQKFFGQEYSQRTRVVPQVHALPETVDRRSARERLGIAQDVFLVCSFGHVTGLKCCDRLASVLRGIPDIETVFVGGCMEADYAEKMADVCVTGSVDDGTYALYLNAADIAVQLRKAGRGETSRAVLDCMAYGVPVIVGDGGAMDELPDDCVLKIGGDFSDDELADAVLLLKGDEDLRRSMGSKGRNHAADFSPEKVGRLVCGELESLYAHDAETHFEEFLKKAEPKIKTMDEGALEQLTKSVMHCRSAVGRNNIYFDISVIWRTDHRTGIQRVVRSLLRSFALDFVSPYRVMPIYISSAGGRRCYRKAPEYLLKLMDEFDEKPGLRELTDIDEAGDIIEPTQNDIFLGADFDSVKIYEAYRDGLFREWSDRGARIHFIVYDLLPLKFPQFFPHHAIGTHADWLCAVGESAEKLFCISKAVADELEHWLAENVRNASAKVDWFHLGADIESSVPTGGLPDDAEGFIDGCRDVKTFLMVGTVEPRKGHYQTVKAFDVLLDEGADVRLVIVGRFGWMADEAVRAIRNSRHFGKGIFWIEDASDEYLNRLYDASVCLLSASFGEGFGLPLIEAAQRGIPLLVRDIPVFREVAGGNAFYFEGLTASGLAGSVKSWIELYDRGEHPESGGMKYLTWFESAEMLRNKLDITEG